MKRLKAGIVGLNFGQQVIDDMLLRSPACELFEVAAVCDTEEKRLNKAVVQLNCSGYSSYTKMLRDEAIQVILLMTGPNGRAELIRQAIQSGKDVITTKPFELDQRAAAAVLKEARDLGRMVYLNSPCAARSVDFEIINQWIDRHDLGRLVGGHYECWYKSVEQATGKWQDDPELCPVAPVFRLGIYGINDFLRWFGEPQELQIMETRLFTGRPTPDLATMNLRFKDGSIATFMNGWVPQPKRSEPSLTLYFENGSVFRNPPAQSQVQDYLTDAPLLTLLTPDSPDGSPIESVKLEPDQLSFSYQWKVYHKAFTTRKRPVNETPDTVIVNGVRILEAMKRASKSGRTEQI
ncbi:MAG: Gfo/Idh/MocA family protein [Puniceicoccaceae bacterium]